LEALLSFGAFFNASRSRVRSVSKRPANPEQSLVIQPMSGPESLWWCDLQLEVPRIRAAPSHSTVENQVNKNQAIQQSA
jgi:hypothetical protein